MSKHQTSVDQEWFHSHYAGEDRDDGCGNELSLYNDPVADQLDLLLTNVDFDDVGHSNTYALNHDDVIKLHDFLQNWLANHS